MYCAVPQRLFAVLSKVVDAAQHAAWLNFGRERSSNCVESERALKRVKGSKERENERKLNKGRKQWRDKGRK